jgi:hypothetical protein
MLSLRVWWHVLYFDFRIRCFLHGVLQSLLCHITMQNQTSYLWQRSLDWIKSPFQAACPGASIFFISVMPWESALATAASNKPTVGLSDDSSMNMEQWWNGSWGGKFQIIRKVPQCHFFHYKIYRVKVLPGSFSGGKAARELSWTLKSI